MRWKFIIPIFALIGITVYFAFYHHSKTLKYVPENADVLILIDVKKIQRQYASELLAHPSLWKESTKKGPEIPLQESGLEIPDYVQIFHVQQTPFSEWYSIFEIGDQKRFLNYLKGQNFIKTGNNTFKKDFLVLKVTDKNVIVGTSVAASGNILESVIAGKNEYPATSFINGGLGSISFISGPRTRNFSIYLNKDNIEVRSPTFKENFQPVINQLQQKDRFFEAELDIENIKKIASLFNTNLADSSEVSCMKAAARLEQVNDTVITYGYDDNFNETEKKTIQKIIQPFYGITLLSPDSEKTMRYFQDKKWINTRNQFTAIPFQPNIVNKNATGLEIQSVKKTVKLSPERKGNYIFVKNHPLLLSSLKTLSPAEKKIISEMEYIFYGNNSQNYYIKLQFKKGIRPLILR